MSEGNYSHYSEDEQHSYVHEQEIEDIEMDELEEPTIMVES